MRNAVAVLLNRTPVPYASRTSALSIPWRSPTGAEAQMRAMGSVSTLFAIVNRLAVSAAQSEWRLYRQARPGQAPEEREEVTRHAALDLWNQPNRFYSRQEFIETFSQHVELTGESAWVVARSGRSALPLELWPVRPDRMTPNPDPVEFLTGWTYTSPDGITIDLKLDEVIQIKMPSPLDPYRGMGPVQTLLTDLDATRYSAEWNKNFFLNSAEPGGIVQVDRRLSDGEFNEMADRWREQHQGVSNAHRVAIIEQAQWVDRKYTMRDMQFAELRDVSREIIREAFGFPKPMLGTTEDVNRANAEASEVIFARWLIRPRLERIKQVLNTRLLALYGASGAGLEFDYTSPVPDDRAADNQELTAKANAAAVLVKAGWDAAGVLETVGLPDMPYAAPTPPPPAVAPPTAFAPVASPAARLDIHHHALTASAGPRSIFDLAPRAATDPPAAPPEHLPDVTPMAAALDAELTDLMSRWSTISDDQKTALAEQARAAAGSGQISDLADLTVDTTTAAAVLQEAMETVAEAAAGMVVAEAAAQGVTLTAKKVAVALLRQVAQLVARLLGRDMATSAARAAMAANSPDATAASIATAVREHLDTLSDANPRRQFGGALHGAMNAARAETLRSGPVGAVYASEVNDRKTCQPCRDIDGKWLGNTDELAQVEKSYPGGAFGGYAHCLGGIQCRGTVVGVWRPNTTGDGQ